MLVIAAVLTLLVGIVLSGIIIAANGYFVAQEFAFMSVDRSALRAQAEAGDARARRALAVTKRTSFMLSGAQLGITITGLLVGYVAEPLIGASIGTLLGGAGIPAGVSIAVGTVGALALATVVQMIFGELYPKNLAIASPGPLARRLAGSTLAYLTVFGWLIAVFDRAANLLLRALRIAPVHDVDASATPHDLRRAVADSRASGHLPEDLSTLIDRVLDFPERDVEHAIVPHSRVRTLAPDATIAAARAEMAGGHTRYPVVSAEDSPVGVVELIDVLAATDPSSPVAGIMRAPVVVPVVMSLPDALAAMREARSELACVVDEFGGFAGIVTVEDLAEELVGELTDEHDDSPPAGIAEDETGWIVDGETPLDEVERAIGASFAPGEAETFAGLLIAETGALPAARDVIDIPLEPDPDDLVSAEHTRRILRVEVLELRHHVPARARAERVTTTDPEGER
nr:hemolysin family protein [Microbacterium excoecariae]